MKILMVCTYCMERGSNPFLAIPIPDDGIVQFTCPNSHKNDIVLLQEKFELLSEVAVTAIVDGYYREAVACFTASMERLFEHFVRVVLNHRNVPDAAVEEAWKVVKTQSERQLGMFIALHLSETGKMAKLLPEKMTKRRNLVIHQGNIPTKDQAIEYGQAVADVVMPLIGLLREEPLKEPAFRIYQQHVLAREAEAKSRGATLNQIPYVGTTFDLHGAGSSVDIAACVKRHAEGRSNIVLAGGMWKPAGL